MSEKLFSDGVDDHIAGTGIEGKDLSGVCAGGDHGEICDTANILNDSSDARIAKEQVVEEGNERSSFAARSHVGGTKIGNDRRAGCCRDGGSLARLPGRGDVAAEKTLWFTLMVKSLSVTADEAGIHLKLALSSQYSVRIQFAQQEIQAGQIGHARFRCVHCGKHSRPNLLGIGIFGMPEQFVVRVSVRPWFVMRGRGLRRASQANESNVNAVSGSSAHHAGYDHLLMLILHAFVCR